MDIGVRTLMTMVFFPADVRMLAGLYQRQFDPAVSF